MATTMTVLRRHSDSGELLLLTLKHVETPEEELVAVSVVFVAALAESNSAESCLLELEN